MFQSLDLFGLSCLFLTVTCQGGQILQPQNVSLVWFSDFKPQLSWAHPQENCRYKVKWSPPGDEEEEVETPPWKYDVRMEGGSLWVSVRTVCGSKESLPVYKNFTYPELVSDLECNVHSSEYARCSWMPVSPHSPSFFYQLLKRHGDSSPTLQACSPSPITDDGRTGCNLSANALHSIRILFNETRDNQTNRNIFYRDFNVKPPALNWTVTKAGDKFIINWTPPDIKLQKTEWRFIINYTECNENKKKDVLGTSDKLDIVPYCRYEMKIKAQLDHSIETPWSTTYSFDADTNPNVLLAATIITPLLIVSLAALLFVCWRKNKNSIFPKVPEPRDLLSDISDNNNKSNVPNLYIPAEEEENCKITLVVDPQNNKLDS